MEQISSKTPLHILSGKWYMQWVLISGFVEAGETLEEAAEREVYEETGIRIRDLQYSGSQPWGFSGSVIAGYTAGLDGMGLARHIRGMEAQKQPIIIFVTGYEKYVYDAFDVGAFRYLVKPVDEQKFAEVCITA